MNTLIKVLLIASIVLILSQCKKDPESINIKDDNFLNALIEQGVDKNGDGIISPEEAAQVHFLYVNNLSISDLKGIEAFVNLEELGCGFNQLTSLDVSKNTALTNLSCGLNQLTTLDVSNNTALTIYLVCYGNQLTSLDVSKNTALEGLVCSNNQFTSLDVSNNTSLIRLECGGNQLTSLNVSNNTSLVYLILGSMPSLQKVCVWTMPFPPAGLSLNTYGSPNVYFTTTCSK
jgi:hypothetical protein